MALDRLTKVDGGGISTTSDYRVGIITASKFVGPFDGSGGNFSGVVTATNGVFSGNVSAVDGNFSGNVTIGGTLTYEDVTNIDSVGIITARSDIHVGAGVSAVGVITGRYLNPSSVSTQNVIIGWESSARNVTGSWNVLLGRRAGEGLTSGGSAVCIGANAGQLLGSSSGIFIGGQAGARVTGGGNVFMGANAGSYTTSATSCVIIGTYAGIDNQGSENTIVGYYAGRGNSGVTDGTRNTFLGTQSGFKIEGGDDNTGVGRHSLRELLGGNKNVAIGQQAGDALVSGNNNIIIGYQADASTSTTSNEITLGDANINHLRIPGIGVSFNNTGGTQLGIITATELDISGDIDVDGHTNLDNVSIAGVSTFSGNINVPDGIVANFGTDNDLFIRHTGNDATIKNNTGNFYLVGGGSGTILQSNLINFKNFNNNETYATFTQNGTVDLYYDNTKTFATNSTGASIYQRLVLEGTGPSILFSDTNNSPNYTITADGGALTIADSSVGNRLIFNANGSHSITGFWSVNGSVYGSDGLSTNGHIDINDDNDKLRIGASDDLQLFHDGSANNNVISGHTGSLNLRNYDTNSTDIILSARNDILLQTAINESAIFCDANAGVHLYYDGSQKFVTTSYGTLITGQCYVSHSGTTPGFSLSDNGRSGWGSNNDLVIYHSSSDNNSYIVEGGTGSLMIQGDIINIGNVGSSKYYIRCFEDGAVQLRYGNNLTKLATTATGIEVTGEVAASQDYPNFRPTLDFNFAATKKLDPRITYQRTGPASFVNEFGKVVLVGDNAPRFDHDPVTRESKGLLIEHSRTNFMKYSDEFAIDNGQTGGNWDAIGGESQWTRVSDTTETKDPTGLTNHASKLTQNTGNVLRGYWYSGAANGAVSKTFSVYLKKATTDATNVTIDIGDTSHTTCVLTDEWKRFSVTTSSAGNGNFVDFSATHTKAFYAWGAQIEAGSYATSYIPTSSAAVTRGPDFAVLQKEDFTDAISQTEGTFIAEYDNVTNDGYVLSLDGSGGDKIGMVNSNGYQLMGQAGGVSQGQTDNGTILSGTNRFALAYKLNDAAISINGNNASVDTSYTLPTTTFMSIGHRQYQYDHLGSCVARIMYYNTRLPNSQLKTLSTR